MSARLQHHAQDLAASLPPLLIEAERVAAAVYQGIHGRRRAGVGESFWQFRRYEQGDAAERIDWRQSSRTDKIYIREREWEAARSATLWADMSGSMQYASRPSLSTKAERAQLLMLALASLMLRGGEKVTWLDRRTITAHGKNGLQQIASRIGNVQGDSVPPDVKLARHGHMVLCSDFLMEPEKLDALMRRYASLHMRGIILHLLDPAEDSFSFEGRVELQGNEGEEPLLLPNAASMRDAYRQRMDAHKTRLEQLAKSAGWFYLRHVTDQSPHLTLRHIYQRFANNRHRSAAVDD
jgi:uncharacterized protein (DUF58 family)